VAYFKDLGEDVNVFFVESRLASRAAVGADPVEEAGALCCFPCLASTDYFNQINCLAFFFTATENLSRRQRMRTLRTRTGLGKR